MNTKASLPDQFTICTSVYNSQFITGQGFFQLMQEDGSTWFNLNHFNMELDSKCLSKVFVSNVYKEGIQEGIQKIFPSVCWLLICLDWRLHMGSLSGSWTQYTYIIITIPVREKLLSETLPDNNKLYSGTSILRYGMFGVIHELKDSES